jgi:outer membrane protein OmpA-like peptidoglycan-associated protein/tetratricopeptide (TPR) repeat protein
MNLSRVSVVAFVGLLFGIHACKPLPFVVKDGNTARELLLYNQSIDFLVKEYNAERDPNLQLQKAVQIADSYRMFGDYANAEKWYKQAVDLNGNAEAVFQLAMMQKQQEKYEEAIRNFELNQRMSNGGFEGRKQALQCREALEWKKAFTKIRVQNLSSLNSAGSDYLLDAYKDGKYAITSMREDASGAGRDGWTGQKFSDIYLTDRKDNAFSAPVNFGTPINTNAHESSPVFTNGEKEMYFIRCGESKAANQYCHLFYTAFNNEHWNEPVRVDIFPDTVNVYDPVISKDGKMMIVAADAPGGQGGTDLYMLSKADTGWSAPLNLGGTINTPGSERYPWLDEKGNLYFSSNGWPGMGGLDIFKALKLKTGYKEPVNLRYPINSGADDFGYRLDKDRPSNDQDTVLSSGFFTSNRAGGKGGDDIYRYEEKWINIYVLKGRVVERQYEDTTNPDSKVLGMIPVRKPRVDLKLANDKVLNGLFADAEGNFTFRLSAETDYKLTARKNGYFNKNEYVTTKGKRNQDSTYIYVYAEIELERIFPEKMIVIPNIYYDYDKATLRPESKLVLDTVFIFFQENPDLTVEIGSHTDSRGSDAYNIKLSQARAQSVVDYLVGKGIPAERLVAKGYGETVPVNGCTNGVKCTEEEHQKNRRTTFRVVSAKLNLNSIEPEDIKVDPKPEEK